MIARIPHLWMVWIKLLIMFCIKTMSKPFIQQNDLVELTLVESMKRGVSYLSASTEITKCTKTKKMDKIRKSLMHANIAYNNIIYAYFANY